MKCPICNINNQKIFALESMWICEHCKDNIKNIHNTIEALIWKAYEKGWYNLKGIAELKKITFNEAYLIALKKGLIEERRE